MRGFRVIFACAFLFLACRSREDSPDAEDSNSAGAEYLRRVMDRLQNERNEGTPVELPELMEAEDLPEPPPDRGNYVTLPSGNATGTTPAPFLHAEILSSSAGSVPEVPPGLTAEELTAIYNAAVTKLANLPQYHSPVQQATSDFHHPPPPPPSPTKSPVIQPATHGPAGGLLPGYYYYYYPIKSFLKTYKDPNHAAPSTTTTTTSKPVLMHATVHMTDSSNKAVEPLFMAISGFIGMALMFAFSVLFVPKFGKLRSGESGGNPNEFLALGRVVFDSMDGKDCAERLACELGRVLRTIQMENKPLRVLEIVLPPHLGKQIAQVRKSAAKREKCSAIPCKLKKMESPTKKPTKKPWKVSQSSSHDLWMKHFEKKTRFPQPENIWEKKRPDGKA